MHTHIGHPSANSRSLYLSIAKFSGPLLRTASLGLEPVGKECRSGIAYINHVELLQNAKYCRDARYERNKIVSMLFTGSYKATASVSPSAAFHGERGRVTASGVNE